MDCFIGGRAKALWQLLQRQIPHTPNSSALDPKSWLFFPGNPVYIFMRPMRGTVLNYSVPFQFNPVCFLLSASPPPPQGLVFGSFSIKTLSNSIMHCFSWVEVLALQCPFFCHLLVLLDSLSFRPLNPPGTLDADWTVGRVILPPSWAHRTP